MPKEWNVKENKILQKITRWWIWREYGQRQDQTKKAVMIHQSINIEWKLSHLEKVTRIFEVKVRKMFLGFACYHYTYTSEEYGGSEVVSDNSPLEVSGCLSCWHLPVLPCSAQCQARMVSCPVWTISSSGSSEMSWSSPLSPGHLPCCSVSLTSPPHSSHN